MNRTLYVLLILVTTFLMGVAFPVGKIGLSYATPFLLMGVRFVFAGLLMAGIVRRRPWPVGAAAWARVAVIGLFQSAGVMGRAYYSMNWVTSGESAILIFMNPLLVIVFSSLITGTKYRWTQWFGVLIGFLGVALTFGLQLSFSTGTLIGFLGAVSFTAATLLVKRWGAGMDTWVMTSGQMFFGGIFLLLASLLAEHPHFTVNRISIMVLLCLVFLCSIVQFSGWFYLLKKGDPGKTSAFLFLGPIFGVLSGWALLGEKVNAIVWVGLGLACAGIFLVNWQGRLGASIPLKKAVRSG
ncbi:EamA family transporter [Paenibacillus sp. P25]|nr:EamA family transporter [Paenibacillus sp. P25]